MPCSHPNESQIHIERDSDREGPASAHPPPPTPPSIKRGLEVPTSVPFEVGDPRSAWAQ